MFNTNIRWSQAPDFVALKIAKLSSWDGEGLSILCSAWAALAPGQLQPGGQAERELVLGFLEGCGADKTTKAAPFSHFLFPLPFPEG